MNRQNFNALIGVLLVVIQALTLYVVNDMHGRIERLEGWSYAARTYSRPVGSVAGVGGE